jgi:AcrR family transcriptional regulator
MEAGTRPYRMKARAAGREATRERIVRAAFELFLDEWYDEVTMRRVATAAGVALQTVVNHFGTKEALFAAVVERFAGEVHELRGTVAPGDLAAAAAAVVAQYERAGDANLRALGLEERVPALGPALEEGRALHRAWVERTFPEALAGLAGAPRARRVAQLAAATDVFTWRLLRRDHRLSPEEAAAAIRELLEALHRPKEGSPS